MVNKLVVVSADRRKEFKFNFLFHFLESRSMTVSVFNATQHEIDVTQEVENWAKLAEIRVKRGRLLMSSQDKVCVLVCARWCVCVSLTCLPSLKDEQSQ